MRLPGGSDADEVGEDPSRFGQRAGRRIGREDVITARGLHTTLSLIASQWPLRASSIPGPPTAQIAGRTAQEVDECVNPDRAVLDDNPVAFGCRVGRDAAWGDLGRSWPLR